MPVTSPAVQEPPFHYRDAELLTVAYETDPEAALDLLPEGLELLEPATASVLFADYHFSTFGPYREAVLTLACLWQGQLMTYVPSLFVSQEAPLIGGREIWGYPKKLAHVELRSESEAWIGTLERPRGHRLATAVVRMERNLPASDFLLPPLVSLKLIPDAEPSGVPALAQLVACDFQVKPVVGSDGVAHLWEGPGSLVFDAPSALDPWHVLPVKRVLACRYGRFDALLPHGRVLKSY
jgi:acetoacetate decarboxylase